MKLNGLHHITAISGKIGQNLQFYTEVLGLRLVKKTVNQDDLSAYHLFYADKFGTPGTDVTFFDWPSAPPARSGVDSIAGTALRVSGSEALNFWEQRLKSQGLAPGQIQEFMGRSLLPFSDPEGQGLYLVSDNGAEIPGEIWPRPDIPDQYAVRGLYGALLRVSDGDAAERILADQLGFSFLDSGLWIDGRTSTRIYGTTAEGGPGRELWVLEDPDADPARQGAGGVHHIAFSINGDQEQQVWLEHLRKAGFGVSPVIDRFWFKSIYFRISPGILFEIATDGPGFGIDEPLENLGEKLVLPPFLEERREQIEAGLLPIQTGEKA